MLNIPAPIVLLLSLGSAGLISKAGMKDMISKFDDSELKLKYYEQLKKGVIDDKAWEQLKIYAQNNNIDLNAISNEERQSLLDKITFDLKNNPESIKYIQESTDKLMESFIKRMNDCVDNGLCKEDFYRTLLQNKSIRNPDEYLQMVKNFEIPKRWHDAFYENNSDVVVSYMSKDAYNAFVLKGGTIGRTGVRGGQFVLPEQYSNSIEKKLAKYGSFSNFTPEFKTQLAKELGLPDDAFESGVMRVEIPLRPEVDLHMVNGIEDGCNYQWVPGCKTLGGPYEGMIRQINRNDDKELYEWIINNAKG